MSHIISGKKRKLKTYHIMNFRRFTLIVSGTRAFAATAREHLRRRKVACLITSTRNFFNALRELFHSKGRKCTYHGRSLTNDCLITRHLRHLNNKASGSGPFLLTATYGLQILQRGTMAQVSNVNATSLYHNGRFFGVRVALFYRNQSCQVDLVNVYRVVENTINLKRSHGHGRSRLPTQARSTRNGLASINGRCFLGRFAFSLVCGKCV